MRTSFSTVYYRQLTIIKGKFMLNYMKTSSAQLKHQRCVFTRCISLPSWKGA